MSTSPVAATTRPPPSSPSPKPQRPTARSDGFFKILSQLSKKTPPSSLPSKAPSASASPSSGPSVASGAPPRTASRKPDEDDLGQGGSERKRRALAEPEPLDLLDPMARQLAMPGCVNSPLQCEVSPAEPLRALRARAASLEDLFGALVRRASWSLGSDRRCATLRLEIGTGALEGSSIVISADPHDLQIVLDAPPGVDMEAWKNRLRLRLASQGLAATFS